MGDRSLYYDRESKPITREQWERLTLTGGGGVAVDRVGDDVIVCTTWFGIDLACGLGGAPLIFETMVFGGPLNLRQLRYATREQALAGHARTVADVTAAAAALHAGGGSGAPDER